MSECQCKAHASLCTTDRTFSIDVYLGDIQTELDLHSRSLWILDVRPSDQEPRYQNSTLFRGGNSSQYEDIIMLHRRDQTATDLSPSNEAHTVVQTRDVSSNSYVIRARTSNEPPNDETGSDPAVENNLSAYANLDDFSCGSEDTGAINTPIYMNSTH